MQNVVGVNLNKKLFITVLFIVALVFSMFLPVATIVGAEDDPIDTYPDEAIAFSTNTTLGPNFLGSVNPDGTKYTVEKSNISKANISPSGTKLVYDDGCNMFTSDRDGSNEVNIVEEYRSNNEEFCAERGVWSPDGQDILLDYYDGEGSVKLGKVNSSGHNLVHLMDDVEYYNWSPNGSKIVVQLPYITEDQQYGSSAVGIINSDGTNLTVIENSDDYEQRIYPSWSPDGTKFAYISNYIGSNTFKIFVINVDGSSISELYTVPDDSYAKFTAWSPDSQKVIFMQTEFGPSHPTKDASIISISISDTDDATNIYSIWKNTETLQWWKKSESNQQQSASIFSASDAYVRGGQTNRNHGADTEMNIQSSGSNRALVKFDQSAIQSAVGSGTVTSAKLRLTITDNGNNWGNTGRTLDIHRLLQDWTEGNGTASSRGTGSGATWDCATDSNIFNQSKDCSGLTIWEMGQPNNPSVHPWFQTATATQTITNNQTGVVEFDVTADVIAFLNGTNQNYGWLVKKTNEGQNGQVSFGTRESSAKPELVITYQP